MNHAESGGFLSVELGATAECAPIRLESRKCVFDIQVLPFQTKTTVKPREEYEKRTYVKQWKTISKTMYFASLR